MIQLFDVGDYVTCPNIILQFEISFFKQMRKDKKYQTMTKWDFNFLKLFSKMNFHLNQN